MASSSTTTSTRLTLQDTLREYEIRLTGRETLPAAPATDEIARRRRPSLSARPVNPPGWDDRHRDVPPYRPINRNLDLTMRPGGQNLIEAAFIAHLFAGVWLKANLSWLWSYTGGRISEKPFTAPIGGEM